MTGPIDQPIRIQPFTVMAGTPPLNAAVDGIYRTMDDLRDCGAWLRGANVQPLDRMDKQEIQMVADGLTHLARRLSEMAVSIHNEVCDPKHKIRLDDQGRIVGDAHTMTEAMNHPADVVNVRPEYVKHEFLDD